MTAQEIVQALIGFRPPVGPDGNARNLWDADSQILHTLGQVLAGVAASRAMLTTLVGRDPSVPIDEDTLAELLRGSIDEEFTALAEQLRAEADAARTRQLELIGGVVRAEIAGVDEAVVERIVAQLAN